MQEIILAALRTGGGTLLCLLFGAVSTKIIAVITGPYGVGINSLAKQALLITIVFASCNGHTPFVQGVASRSEEERPAYVKSVFWAMTFSMLTGALVIIVAAPLLAPLVFGGVPGATAMFRWIALPTAFSVMAAFLAGLLNGRRQIGSLALMNVSSSVATMVLAWPCAKLVNIGYPVAFIFLMAATQLSGCVYSLWILHRSNGLRYLSGLLDQPPSISLILNFLRIAFSTLASALVATGSTFLMRLIIRHRGGLEATGYFDTSWTLCMMYASALLTSFSTYYMPRLSGLHDREQRLTLMHQVFRIILLVSVPVILGLIVLKPLTIQIVYSRAFLPALPMMQWMLIGDFFRVGTWVLGTPMLAYLDMRRYLAIEAIAGVGYVLGTALAMFWFHDIEWIGISYIAVSILNFTYVLRYAARYHGFSLRGPLWSGWLSGLALVAFFSWLCLYRQDIGWGAVLLLIPAIGGYLWRNISLQERREIYRLLMRCKAIKL